LSSPERFSSENFKFEILDLKFRPDSPPLAGSLPFGVRTFLFFEALKPQMKLETSKQRSPDLLSLQGRWIIANGCSTGTAGIARSFKPSKRVH